MLEDFIIRATFYEPRSKYVALTWMPEKLKIEDLIV